MPPASASATSRGRRRARSRRRASVRMTPPSARRRLRARERHPPRRWHSHAAASPAMPPPMTRTRGDGRVVSSTCRVSRRDAGARTGRAPARLERRLGRMPWPRLKMWPGRPPARSQDVLGGGAARGGSGPSRSVGSRLPWMARSEPMRSQASSSGVRQSAPMTSPPAVAHVLEDVDGADAEVDRGTSGRRDGLEDPAGVGQRELAVVARAERADPGVEHLHGLDACLDLGAEVARRPPRRAARTAGARPRVRRTSGPWSARSRFDCPPSMA